MNESYTIHINLKIPNHPDEILDYTKHVLHSISQHASYSEVIQRKIKLIIIELVTNSIKHSKDPDALIQLTLSDPGITIQKVDKGAQVKFASDSEQIPFEEIDKITQVRFSEHNSYHIKILDQYGFKFLDPFKEGMNIENIPEHFGFYIITRASDSFTYEHNPDLHENRFTALLKLEV